MPRTLLISILTFVCIAVSSGPVSAEESSLFQSLISGESWPVLSHLAITILGSILATHLALEAFARPVQVANAATFPKYMTSPSQYQLGRWLFVIFACGFFLLLVYEHQQVLAVADVLGDGLAKRFLDPIKEAAISKSSPYLLTVAAMGGIYLILLRTEAQWNILLTMRDVIRGWISVPQFAKLIVGQITTSLQVPQSAIQKVVAHSVGLNEDDFHKDRNIPDRQWAEICYMKWWLVPRQEAGRDVTFFTDECFGFERLLINFEETSWGMHQWKSGGAATVSMTQLANTVKQLHEKFSRLVACYLIYRNALKQDLHFEAQQFGIDVGNPRPENPVRYWIVYVIALMTSVYLGVHASALVYDWFFGIGSSNGVANADRAVAWMMYSLCNYGLAIMAILLFRFVSQSAKGDLIRSHLITYCWTFAAAYVVGPLGLALAVHEFGNDGYRAMSIELLYFDMLKWGLGPALVCVYISYYLDRQTCQDLPNIDHSLKTIWWRLLNCFGFASVTVFLLLPQLLALVSDVSDPVWDLAKLRFVATGTNFWVAFGLALAAQFALRKRTEMAARVVSPQGSRLELSA
jgi:hypothetical protein